MVNRKKNQKNPKLEVTNNASDAEFGIEYIQSKEVRKNSPKEKK
ncbi:hypothetical protein [Salipaludibacillus daqingensis]|nr:hypothetical protein [Salipaludibacillus daqingensis]